MTDFDAPEPGPTDPTTDDRTAESGGVDRRHFLGLAGAAAGVAGLAMSGASPAAADAVRRVGRTLSSNGRAALPSDLFTLGVASGDPTGDAVVLWTRLAPEPLAGGGMPDQRVPVQWEVATDESFSRVVRQGLVRTTPDVGHSVHVDVRGLKSQAEYFYRFKAGNEISPVGRTQTAPAPASSPRALRFVSSSCQNREAGYYPAWDGVVADAPDFVAFLGDYIYEGASDPAALRPHEGTTEPTDIVGYRNRYGQYRSDPSLQEAHRVLPWIITFDDHEVDNNWADEVPQDPDKQAHDAFVARRAAAFQVWWEHMPVRLAPPRTDGSMRIYRRFEIGDLVRLHVLDTRQYRSDQIETLTDAYAPGRTMTGAAQEQWLFRGLRRPGARWHVLANQVMVAQNDRTAGPTQTFDFDNWDGYRWQRARLMDAFAQTRNPVVLTGDRHASWFCDLKPDFDDPDSPVVGAEYTGTSIASGGDSNLASFHATFDPIKADSPHWKFIDSHRGYLLHDVSRRAMVTQARVVSTVLQPTAPVSTLGTFVTEDGVPGVQEA